MKVELCHTLEDMAGSLSVGFRVRRGDEEVIHVDNQPSFSDHVLEQVIHELLECSRGIAKAEEHDCRFKESFVHDEGHFPLVTIFDADIIVPPSNVKFSKVMSVFEFIHEVRDEGKGVGIAGGVFIEVSVVLAGAELTIFLLDKEERRCLRRVGRTDFSSS